MKILTDFGAWDPKGGKRLYKGWIRLKIPTLLSRQKLKSARTLIR